MRTHDYDGNVDMSELMMDHIKEWFKCPRKWCRDLGDTNLSYCTCIFLLHGFDRMRLSYCSLLDVDIHNNMSRCTDFEWSKIALEVM